MLQEDWATLGGSNPRHLSWQSSPCKDLPKALSGLSFRPNPCPLSACH